MKALFITKQDISDIEAYTGASSGIIRPLPVAEVEKFGWEKIRLFMHVYGLYTLPTVELIDYLAGIVCGKRAIEIGAGMGVIGRSLGIPITDSRMQELPEVKAYYDAIRQPVIRYPDDVEKLDAFAAVEKYEPEVVIGSYITHLWKPGMESGNPWGVDTLELIKRVPAYYMIGDSETHRNDPAMKYLDGIEHHDFLYTRGGKETSVIFRWKH